MRLPQKRLVVEIISFLFAIFLFIKLIKPKAGITMEWFYVRSAIAMSLLEEAFNDALTLAI